MGALLDIGTSGMLAQNKQIKAIGNNIANSQTPAYKASSVQFSDTFYNVGGTAGSGVLDQSGNGAATKGNIFNWQPGGTDQTGKKTHMAITEEKGMFPVLHQAETKFSRAGDFSFAKDKTGDIVLARPNGAQLMVDDGAGNLTKLTFSGIPSSLQISASGEIRVATPPEQDPDGDGTSHPTGPGILVGQPGSEDIDTNGDGTLDGFSSAQIRLQTFGNPDTLLHESGGLFQTTTGTVKGGDGLAAGVDGDPADTPVIPGEHGAGSLQQGYLEQSNVDLVREFADMIATQRAYQANSRTIQTADDLLKEALSLKR